MSGTCNCTIEAAATVKVRTSAWVQGTFTDRNGQKFNPDEVMFWTRDPAGNLTKLTYDGVSTDVVRVDKGVYEAMVYFSIPSTETVDWTAGWIIGPETALAAANEVTIQVLPSRYDG